MYSRIEGLTSLLSSLGHERYISKYLGRSFSRVEIFDYYFKGLAVFSIHKRAVSIFKNVVKF